MERAEPPGRYRAFISYSHRDAAFGRRLHRRLESYALPRRLVGRPGARGPTPRRLAPIFRDREELAAAHDLTAEVRAALAASDSLVVVCSPHARASPWVAREIEVFRALHPGRPVLAALVDGEPGACFPEPLRLAGTEPLAADFRKSRDGSRLALLKLVAGIAGVGLDQLVQRDAQRRLRGVTAVTAGALVLALGMSGLAAFALQSRAEAERQRAEAEGLVEFMLTDLRDRLEGVGRLDVLTAVNRRALDHYADQDLSRLGAESLERRARILHAMGEDDMSRGDLDAALSQFREAGRATAALLAADPQNPERIWAHAQSQFWVGSVDYARGRPAAAKQAFLGYRDLSDALVAKDPDDGKYLREAGYAEGNLCSVALEPPKDPAAAVRSCTVALARMEAAARRLGSDPSIAADLVNRHAWLADAYRSSGDGGRARAHRLAQERILTPLIVRDPNNMDLKETWIVLQRAMARLDADAGQPKAARARLKEAITAIDALIAFDSANEEWRDLKADLTKDLSRVQDQASSKGLSHG